MVNNKFRSPIPLQGWEQRGDRWYARIADWEYMLRQTSDDGSWHLYERKVGDTRWEHINTYQLLSDAKRAAL